LQYSCGQGIGVAWKEGLVEARQMDQVRGASGRERERAAEMINHD